MHPISVAASFALRSGRQPGPNPESTELRPWAQSRPPGFSSSTHVSLRTGLSTMLRPCGPRRLRFELGLPLAVVVSRIGLMKRGARTGLNPRQPQSAKASKAGRQRTTAHCSLSWLLLYRWLFSVPFGIGELFGKTKGPLARPCLRNCPDL